MEGELRRGRAGKEHWVTYILALNSPFQQTKAKLMRSRMTSAQLRERYWARRLIHDRLTQSGVKMETWSLAAMIRERLDIILKGGA